MRTLLTAITVFMALMAFGPGFPGICVAEPDGRPQICPVQKAAVPDAGSLRKVLVPDGSLQAEPAPASAATRLQETRLRSMATRNDGKGWEAVGRLNLGPRGYCTGSLIAPDLVLTAAHCVYDNESGALIAPEDMTFLAGWRHGQAVVYRDVRRGVVHADYVFEGTENMGYDRIAADVALLELERPIRLPNVKPFPTANRPRSGDAVGVVSYARNRSEAPSIQEICRVKMRVAGVAVLSCDIDFGSSGAPVFAVRDGKPQVVSVISAKADTAAGKIALAALVDTSVANLRRRLKEGDVTFERQSALRVNVGDSASRASGNSKFVRP